MDRAHQKSWFEPNFEFNSVMEWPSHYGKVVYYFRFLLSIGSCLILSLYFCESSLFPKNTIAFLNKVQKVAYTLNPFIVEVAERLQEEQISVGKFLPINDESLNV